MACIEITPRELAGPTTAWAAELDRRARAARLARAASLAAEEQRQRRLTADQRRLDVLIARAKQETPELLKTPRWRRIVDTVLDRHGLTLPSIRLARKIKIVRCKQELFYALAAETSLSLPEIGRRCGGFSHATVLHGVRRHAARNGLPMPGRFLPGERSSAGR